MVRFAFQKGHCIYSVETGWMGTGVSVGQPSGRLGGPGRGPWEEVDTFKG